MQMQRAGDSSMRLVRAWLMAGASVMMFALLACLAITSGATPALGQAAGHQENNGVMEPVWVTEYVIVRVPVGVQPVVNDNGRWSFELTASALASVPAKDRKLAQQSAQRATQRVRALLRDAGVTDVQRMGAWKEENIERARMFRLDRYYKVLMPAGTSVAGAKAMVESLRAEREVVEHAELDALGMTAGVMPNDPDFDLEYGLFNMSTPGADINATNAWTITTGAPQTVLAVLDSGVSAHTDLAGRMVAGINTVDNTANTVDACNHGTHCAGTAAANSNNGIGIAGMNWHTRVMPVRVLTGCGGNEADLSDGLQWAADHGAHVINMSLQFSTGSQYLHDGVLYARAAGVVLVAASGNWGFTGGVAFPGRWPETITVAAHNSFDTIWAGSNAGPEVTITAPGESIWSLSAVGNSYLFISGTSMATAHVSGLAMLMLTVDPSLTHDEIQQILIDTAVDRGAPGFDTSFGHGRVDAHAALLAVKARLGIPGDVNSDEQVNALDHDALEALIGLQWGEPGYSARADLNHDGTIDAIDQAILDDVFPICLADLVETQSIQPPGDGVIDGADLAYLLGQWGANPGSPADIVTNATIQPPADGMVDGADLAYLLSWWGICSELAGD